MARAAILSGVLGTAICGPTAEAADLPVKDLPDTLTWNGITLWGVVDVGYAYQTNGAPLNAPGFWGVNSNIFADLPAGRGPLASLTENGRALSSVGIKIDEPLGNGWRAVGSIDTGFAPLYGALDDGCATLIANNGKPGSQQTVASDLTRCGQPLNGNAFGGISNTNFGTLTVGRQAALASLLANDYDAMDGSIAFSLLGWAGSIATGAGLAEGARWDDSIKYTYQYGPFHVGLMYHEGAQDTGIHGSAYGANIGATWGGFSVDAVYSVLRDGISASEFGVGKCNVPGAPSCNTLSVTGTNTDGYGIAGKKVFDLGTAWNGSPGRLTFYAGYSHVRNSDPSDPINVGDTGANGYVIGAASNTTFLFGDRIRQTEWTGLRYEAGPWSFNAAYYHLGQSFFKASATSTFCSNNTASNCAGDSNTVSAVVDYAITKHFDVYGGVEWSNISGGFDFGYPVTTLTTVTTGVVFKF